MRAAGILRQVGFHNPAAADGEPAGQKPGYGLNVSGTWKLFGKDQINGQVVGGRGIASYMNDGGIDLAPNANLNAETVQTLGWLLYYNHSWSDKWSSALGYSEHKQSNTDGQLGSGFKRGSYASVNALYSLTKNVTSGVEYIWGKHETKDGLSATDYRLQWSTRVTF
jgi:hypothetical protein